MDNFEDNESDVICPFCKGNTLSKEDVEKMAYEEAYKDYFLDPDEDKCNYESPEEYAKEKFDDYITYTANEHLCPLCKGLGKVDWVTGIMKW
jgi:hypothetical protein